MWILQMMALVFAACIPLSASSSTDTIIGVTGKDFVMIGYQESITSSILVTSSTVNKLHVIREPRSSGEVVAIAAAGELPDVHELVSQIRADAAMQDYAAMVDVEFVDLKPTDETMWYGEAPNPSQGLSVTAIAKLARTHIAQNLRSAAPYRVGLLVTGMHRETNRPWGVASRTKAFLKDSTLDFVSGHVQRQLQGSVSALEVSEEEKETHRGDPEKKSLTADTKLQPYLYWLDEYGSIQKIGYGSHGLGSNFVLAVLDQGYRKNLTREEAASLIHKCFEQLEGRYIINSPKPPVIQCVDSQGCHQIITKS
jgi:20S proteasome alpha/beta subunit